VSAYEVRSFDELEKIFVAGVHWRPIRRPLGITAFGINAYTANVGDHVVEEHTEKTLGHEEVYVVIAGRATFTLEDDRVDVPAGAFVYVRDPQTRRGAVAAEDGTTVLAVGGVPGTHEASGWEWSFAAEPARERRDYDAAVAILREGLGTRPGRPYLLYDLACAEALAGRRDDALAHLREAVDAVPRLRDHASRDDDFASLRDDPEFLAIAGESDAGGQGA
jgi:tetratricopeptide (TPR) repeat protein